MLATRLLRAFAADSAGDFDTADARYLRLQETADSRRWMLESTALRLRRARVALELGRAADAVALLDEATAQAEPLRLVGLQAWALAVRPAALAAAGDTAAARQALRAASAPDVDPRLRTSAAAAVAAALRTPAARGDAGVEAALERLHARLAGG